MPISKTILITELSGFTRFYLSEMFREKGYQVVGLSNEAEQDTIVCDPLDRNQPFRAIECVNPSGVILNLLEETIPNGVRCLVFLPSSR